MMIFDITLSVVAVIIAVAVLRFILEYERQMNKRVELLDKQIERQELENQVFRNAHPGPRMLKDD